MTGRPRSVTTPPGLESLRAMAFEVAPDPALILSPEGSLVAVNEAAEALFGQGLSLLTRGRFRDALPPGSALTGLVDRAMRGGVQVRERGLEIVLFGHPPFDADGAAAPMDDGSILLTLQVRHGALGVERGAEAAGLRSVVGLGRMLAHEIKNPLAGIRGAAQLLKTGVRVEDASLAQLIVDEVDRIKRLVDRMEAFSEEVIPDQEPVNIHQVLDRVRALAVNGVADGLALRENYDPSLPPTIGDEDMLIQVFLNLVKNACRGRPFARRQSRPGDHHHRLSSRRAACAPPRARAVRSAPLEVRIQDNGPGVAPDLREHLFEPFVTSKSMGAGLGLAAGRQGGHRPTAA